jgi:hypothetical protein
LRGSAGREQAVQDGAADAAGEAGVDGDHAVSIGHGVNRAGLAIPASSSAIRQAQVARRPLLTQRQRNDVRPEVSRKRTILDMIIYGRPNRTYAAWRLS